MAQETGLRVDDERDEVNSIDSEDDAALALSDDTATDETDEIRDQIEETRASMGDTIDAIQEKLSFSNISEQVSEQVTNAIETAKDTVYDATLGKAVSFMKNSGKTISSSSLGQSIAANPWPYALIGLGSAWLVYSSMSGNKRRYRGDGSQYRVKNYLTSHGREEQQRSGGMLSDATRGVSSAAGNAYDSVTSRAGDAYDSVATTANDAYRSASDAAGRAYDKVGEYGHIAQEKYEYYVEEKPLAVAAAAAAVGAAIGFAIPSSRYEGQLMGDTRDQLMNTAGEAAGDLVDKAKQVASEAGKTIKDEISSATEQATAKQPVGRSPIH